MLLYKASLLPSNLMLAELMFKQIFTLTFSSGSHLLGSQAKALRGLASHDFGS